VSLKREGLLDLSKIEVLQDSILKISNTKDSVEYNLNTLIFQNSIPFEEVFCHSEFDSKDLKGSGIQMKESFREKLIELNKLTEKRYKINSGYRTIRHNRRVGGVTHSNHLKGLAVDISIRNSADRYRIIWAALQVGFTQIGIGKTFIHIGLDHNNNKTPRIWLY